ncbi:hypothetical protein F6H22_06645 [Vibrio cholerae]|nr:hypothetical protein [Vibrio cholerae]EGQ9331683.1 hypothetical protein [Vibrio cholerae]EGQ9834259.1 hypothetical protein [Vibrio cholerae]TQO99770.1 hypothetical protein FLL97_13235 [Vibrio cholerae]TXX53481.1 hypothetical protein FXF07_16045 [Vibrio cholerae]
MSHTRLIFSILFPCFLCRLYATGEEKIAPVFYLSPRFLSITEFSIEHRERLVPFQRIFT